MQPAFDTGDTIVAIATPPGRGGIGIVRLSGSRAIAILKELTDRNGPFPARTATLTSFHDKQGRVIDQGLVLVFPGPASFTGEDVAECHAHGSPVVLDQLLQSCLHHGARLAQPGEFSQRAFLNGQLDLTQAEAIADLIDAGSDAAARAAVKSLQGDFSQQINALVERLVRLRMHVEAAIDFPDEDVDFLADQQIATELNHLLADVTAILATTSRGRLLREGMTLVIAGRPNAGKSSLLNALAGHAAAIVTDIPGTTRDVLRESIQIDGLPLHIIDTAGLRESPDPVEHEGIRRAWQQISQADHLLLILDSTTVQLPLPHWQDLLPDDPLSATARNIPVTVLLNKADLSGLPPGALDESGHCHVISATSGAGLDDLRHHLKQLAGYQETTEHLFTARRRHVTALEQARAALEKGQQQLVAHTAGELLAEDLRGAQKALEEITGAFTPDDLLGRIFADFCIGK